MHNRGKVCYRWVDKGCALAIRDEEDFQSWGWDTLGAGKIFYTDRTTWTKVEAGKNLA